MPGEQQPPIVAVPEARESDEQMRLPESGTHNPCLAPE